MKTTKLLALAALFIFGQHCTAQVSEMPDFKSIFTDTPTASPEMASMVRNITYPVNYSTGLVNISIPLFEIKCADIKIPITLNYHASGVKLGAASGWVGQNWSLQCEPMISRTIRGRDDFYSNFKCDIDFNDKSQSYGYFIAKNIRDGQPDEYYFSLPEYQGEFIYLMNEKDPKHQYSSLPYQNLRIINLNNNTFQIIDDKGRVYNFGGICEETGTSTPLGWKGTSIVSSNKKDSVTFSYFQNQEYSKYSQDCIVVIDNFSDHKGLYTDRDYFRGQFNADYNIGKEELMCPLRDYWMHDPVVYSTVYNGRNHFCDIYTYQSNNEGTLYKDWKYQNYVQTEYPKTFAQKLSQISFPSGKVVMKHSHKKDIQGEILDEIDVYNISDDLVRRIKLEYDLKPMQQRSYLHSVEITGELGKQSEKYEFCYDNINSLPYLGNKSIDYWGYYNGVHRSDTTTLVPYQKVETMRTHRNFNNSGYWTGTYNTDPEFHIQIGSPLSREASEEHMRYGTLKSITYPTGAKDVFEYEAHRYHDNSIGTRLAGGLRIKSITTYCKDTALRTRTFRYGQDEDGLGYSPMSSNLEHFIYEQKKQYISPIVCGLEYGKSEETITANDNEVITARHRTFFSNPINSNTYNGGSAVMYEYVTEYDGTPTSNNGKVVYHYNIDTDTLSAPIMTMARNDTKRYWNYGQLLSTEIYKNTNGYYSLVKSISYQYDTKKGNFGSSKVWEGFLTNVIEGDETLRPDLLQANSAVFTDVEIGAKVLNKKTERIYDDKGYMSENIINYSYNNSAPLLLRNMQDARSGGSTINTAYKYPEDFNEGIYAGMNASNQYSVIQTEYTSGNKYMSLKTPYSQLASGSSLPMGKEFSYASTEEPKERVSYRYNKYGNKIEETKDNKEHVVFLYGYNHQEIVAVVENATYEEVSSVLGISTIESIEDATSPSFSVDTFSELRKRLPNARVYSYLYKPLVGISEMTTPNGQTTYFEYDELGRLNKSYQIINGKKETLKNYQYKYKTEE